MVRNKNKQTKQYNTFLIMNNHLFPYNWKLSEANFTKDKGTVFSCFSCGGGSTMGYKLAGFDVLGCNEIDKEMIKSYRLNHRPKFSYMMPIQKFKIKQDIPEELFNLDILDGSPPCSSFSMSGDRDKQWGNEKIFREGQKKQVLDTLFFDFIELADRLRPKVVIAENVKGMLMGNARPYITKIHKMFDEAGYYSQHFLLDASFMGVPQKRERVFFICLRKDLASPFMKTIDMFNNQPYINMEFNEKPILFGKIRSEIGKDYSNTERGLLIKHRIKSDKSINDINKRINNKTSGFNSIIVHDEQVMPTITAGEKSWRYFDGMACSDEDYKNCGSYPQDYYFCGANKNDGIVKYLIGMSVPPVMVAQIAKRVYDEWLSKL